MSEGSFKRGRVGDYEFSGPAYAPAQAADADFLQRQIQMQQALFNNSGRGRKRDPYEDDKYNRANWLNFEQRNWQRSRWEDSDAGQQRYYRYE